MIIIVWNSIDVVGSGPSITRLVGSLQSSQFEKDSALVHISNKSSLLELGVENTSSSNFSIGVYASGNEGSAMMDSVSVTVRGTGSNIGIYNDTAFLKVKNSSVVVTGASNVAGIYSIAEFDAFATLRVSNTEIVASGSAGPIGIANDRNSVLFLRSSEVETDGTGVLAFTFSTAMLIANSAIGGGVAGRAQCVASSDVPRQHQLDRSL